MNLRAPMNNEHCTVHSLGCITTLYMQYYKSVDLATISVNLRKRLVLH